MQQRFGAVALVATLGFAMAACGDDDDTAGTGTEPDTTTAPDGSELTPADLDGREFVSDQVDGHDLVAGSTIRISFTGDEIGVDAGCNQMGGVYTLTDGVLVTEQLATTEMACDQPLMDQDAWLAGLLTTGAELSVDGDTLVLTGETGTITATDREVAEPDAALEGTEWTLESLLTGDTASSTVGDAVATMVIGNGSVSLDTGCNTGTGDVEVGDGTLTFGPIALTRMSCEEDLMAQEATLVQALSGEVGYVIDGNRLSITTTTGDFVSGLDFTAAG